MADPMVPSDEFIQDYIDGRLSGEDQVAMSTYLLTHPEHSREIERLRLINSALSGTGQRFQREPVPNHLKSLLHTASQSSENEAKQEGWWKSAPSLLTAVAVTGIALLAGGWAGWSYRESLIPRVDKDQMAMRMAENTFRLYGVHQKYPVEFPPDRQSEFLEWMRESFSRQIQPPDLTGLGYSYIGGRLVSWQWQQSGFFLYENPNGERLAISVWPRDGSLPTTQTHNANKQRKLTSRFLHANGFGFAVLTQKPENELTSAVDKIQQFYNQLFTSEKDKPSGALPK